MHPLYQKARATWEKQQGTPYADSRVYLETAEVAKLLRERLKREFPGAKFSVKSHSYSGGSSVDVRWTDGPGAKVVQAVANGYNFSTFDGMIDLKTSVARWLSPDGSIAFASTPGTATSRGCHERHSAAPPHPHAVKVGGGPDYVFCHREITDPTFCDNDHDLIRGRIGWSHCPACRLELAAS